MSIEVRYAEESDRERWNDLVERSPSGTPFHLREFGEVVADYAGATYDPLIGYKGQEPVGLFPTHQVSKGPVTAVFSPPPDLYVTYQGPTMVNTEKLKQRKEERRHRRFVRGCLDCIESAVDPSYIHIRTGSRYLDTRPFVRADFDATPGHTYVVDIAPDEETLLAEFSSDARQNITGEYEGVRISEEGEDAIRAIVEQVRERHDEQDEHFPVEPAYVVDLFRSLPDGVCRPYVCRVDGDMVGGMIALELDDTTYRWIGGAKHDADAPVNDLVDWYIIRDAKSRGVTRYDLVGASELGIAKYKAKFAPSLELYQQLERGTRLMQLASSFYSRLRK